MRYDAEPAYVLHARPWRETSLLLELLTENHGRLGLVARGVQGPKKHVLRAALQPLQHIRFDGVQRGELAQLRTAEAIDAAPRLSGEAGLAAFYVSELTLRLAPRQDPHSGLYELYGQVRERLREGAPLSWTLRRFERDLLEALGFVSPRSPHGHRGPCAPARRYRLDAEHGPRPVLSERIAAAGRSPDRESELQSLMRITYAVLC